jgi:hypothetical protein
MLPLDLGIGKLLEDLRDAVIVAEAGTGKIALWKQSLMEIFVHLLSSGKAFYPHRVVSPKGRAC